MSILNRIVGSQPQTAVDPNALDKQEIELLLSLVKQSHFPGESLENLYNLVLKLQNQYLSLDK